MVRKNTMTVITMNYMPNDPEMVDFHVYFLGVVVKLSSIQKSAE